jgi:hypothetical protein
MAISNHVAIDKTGAILIAPTGRPRASPFTLYERAKSLLEQFKRLADTLCRYCVDRRAAVRAPISAPRVSTIRLLSVPLRRRKRRQGCAAD